MAVISVWPLKVSLSVSGDRNSASGAKTSTMAARSRASMAARSADLAGVFMSSGITTSLICQDDMLC